MRFWKDRKEGCWLPRPLPLFTGRFVMCPFCKEHAVGAKRIEAAKYEKSRRVNPIVAHWRRHCGLCHYTWNERIREKLTMTYDKWIEAVKALGVPLVGPPGSGFWKECFKSNLTPAEAVDYYRRTHQGGEKK